MGWGGCWCTNILPQYQCRVNSSTVGALTDCSSTVGASMILKIVPKGSTNRGEHSNSNKDQMRYFIVKTGEYRVFRVHGGSDYYGLP